MEGGQAGGTCAGRGAAPGTGREGGRRGRLMAALRAGRRCALTCAVSWPSSGRSIGGAARAAELPSPRPSSPPRSRRARAGRGEERGSGGRRRLRVPGTIPSRPRNSAASAARCRPPSAPARPGRVRHGSAGPCPQGRGAQRPLSRPPPPSCQSRRGLRRRLPAPSRRPVSLRLTPPCPDPPGPPAAASHPPPRPRLRRHRHPRGGLGRCCRISRPASFPSHRLNLRRRTAAPLAAAAARDTGAGGARGRRGRANPRASPRRGWGGRGGKEEWRGRRVTRPRGLS